MRSTRPLERPDAGHAHVWLIDLDAPFDAGILSSAERERAGEMQSTEVAQRWSAARAALRELLGRYTGETPEGLYLRPTGRQPPVGALNLSVSHSAGRGAAAIASVPVGVDIEVDRPVENPERLVARLGPEAVAAVSAARSDARAAAFLQAWTRHEARLKLGDETPWLREFRFVGATGALAAPRPLRVDVRNWP